MTVLRFAPLAIALTLGLSPISAATLERLSLDDMIAKSTAIVRGKVASSFGLAHGPVVYTHYRIQVAERYKGTSAATTEIIVPGGTANGLTQNVAGAPQLSADQEYVLFLWTGPSGNTQIIGLTQGLFAMPGDTSADPMVVRHATTEMMIDSGTGLAVRDQRLSMRLSDLRSRISGTLRALGDKGVTR